MFRTLDISTSGLLAQRQRMDTIAGNIAQANTTQAADGAVQPFQRRIVLFQADTSEPQAHTRGVGVKYEVETDTATPPRRIHDPGHPHADAQGYVSYPNVNLITEFVNAIEASRAYEANLSAIELSKEMSLSTLKILA